MDIVEYMISTAKGMCQVRKKRSKFWARNVYVYGDAVCRSKHISQYLRCLLLGLVLVEHGGNKDIQPLILTMTCLWFEELKDSSAVAQSFRHSNDI